MFQLLVGLFIFKAYKRLGFIQSSSFWRATSKENWCSLVLVSAFIYFVFIFFFIYWRYNLFFSNKRENNVIISEIKGIPSFSVLFLVVSSVFWGFVFAHFFLPSNNVEASMVTVRDWIYVHLDETQIKPKLNFGSLFIFRTRILQKLDGYQKCFRTCHNNTSIE